jgi:TonB-dependent receptor
MSFSSRARAALTISTLALLAVSALARAAGVESAIAGRVLDAASGEPVEGASVLVTWPAPTDGSSARKETRVTAADGTWEVTGVPAGTYSVRIEKSGFKPAQIARFVVRPGESPRADLSLTALSGAEPDLPAGVEEFVVVGTKAEAIEASRADSDQLLNTLSAEEFSKFAANDVADALKFVPGVNVVKGQFAIIRGLEDRYSSTLYNGAPIPSPDPDRQSIPLDLFPSEVVSNLVVAKTFAPSLPSNSSGGSINIVTEDYPEGMEARLTTGVSLNQNARDSFWHYDSGSSVGRESDGWGNVLGSEFGLSLAGRSDLREREYRYKLVLNREVQSDTAFGTQEGLEPVPRGGAGSTITRTGGLSLGRLSLSDGKFDLTDSAQSTQTLGYGGFGFDLDQEGNHKIDISAFYTKKQEQVVELKQNGYLPNFDYGTLAQKQLDGNSISASGDFPTATLGAWIARTVRESPDDPPSKGPIWFSNFSNSTSFARDRDLLVTQVNADHTIESLQGLHMSWAANYANTTQKESARGTRIFFDPNDPSAIPSHFPASLADLGPGRFMTAHSGILENGDDVNEHQYFGRIDADYTRDVLDFVTLRFDAGGWFENAQRSVSANFVQDPRVNSTVCQPAGQCIGAGTQFVVVGDTANDLGHTVFNTLLREPNGDFVSQRDTSNHSSRKIDAGDFGGKATLFERVDLLGGARVERIRIDSNNDPFTGEVRYGAPAIFPEAYLFFDRLDNVDRGEVFPAPKAGTVFNDEILGIKVPIDPKTGLVDLLTREQIGSLVNGHIDETKMLPSAGFAYRPIDGLALRGAYSQTVARPSFREMGYYVSVEPGSDDLIVGNPQLKLSDVESYDLRAEYTWGDVGDLVALSSFYKSIQNPIESIVVRNPINLDASSSALYRTFFNNPNQARLWGLEAEARKNLGFAGFDFAQFFSVGANATYIDAKVGRTQAELARAQNFFGAAPGDTVTFQGMKQTRRLFGQPEWIVNADLTFDQPDWGTKATLAFFAISDVLDAAGTGNIDANGEVFALTLDQYVDSFSRLDLIVSQTVHWDFFGSDVIFKISAKNLTDTTRRLIYDPGQTAARLPERSYKLGRDFKFTMTLAF